MLDFVQVVSDHVARSVGLDEDALHWVSVAIRESVINAIKHGNRNDASKRVFVEFETAPARRHRSCRSACAIKAKGFDPEAVADPLAPENLLKSSGRGIFLIRNFMDDVQLQRAPEGGMEIRMPSASAHRAIVQPECRPTHSFSPRRSRPSSAPASCRWRGSARTFSIDKKGTIDLVTEVDLAVERMFRALIARALSRSSDPGRRTGRRATRARRDRAGCSIRSTARRTTRTACRSSARRSRSKSTAWPRSPRCTIRTAGSCSPPSAAAARF